MGPSMSPPTLRYRKAVDFWTDQSPPVLFAGDYLATATLEGALRTGLWAAQTLLQEDTLRAFVKCSDD